MKHLRIALIALVCSGLVSAQDVGMGRRRGTGAKLEAPYTLEIETPHVKWARPLAGGPIKLLAVPTVSEGRTLVELAQRLSLDLTTVSIDPRFDANKWTMGFGRDYGARAEKGDLSRLYGHLEQELTSDKKFDVILLPVNHGWERLTPASREAIARRVKEGCGLVLIRPFDTELSPLVPTSSIELPADKSEAVEPGAAESSPWKRSADHYVTRAIPVEQFPFEYIQNYAAYEAAPDAEVLIQSASGKPVLAVRPYGKGRIVAFGYKNAGLAWFMPGTARGFVSDLYWEYFYSLLCRSMIFAAGREPSGIANFEAADAEWRLKSEDGVVKSSGKGKPASVKPAAPGRYFLEQQTASDWKISAIDVPTPAKIENLKADRDVLAEGNIVKVTWKAPRPAVIEIMDGLGRVIGRGTGSGTAAIKVGRPLVHNGFVRATMGSVATKLAVQFAASSREWTDYEVLMPWYGPGSYHPWIPALDEQFRKIGLTTLSRPDRNFKILASAGLHDEFGVYGYRSDKYAARKKAYAETKDKKYLTRDVVLQSPDFDQHVRATLKERIGPLVPLKPLAYYLADESSLTSYTDAFDVDWAPEALAGFREWLKKEYPNLDALNASWGTAFTKWDDVAPMTTEEAQKHGNYAPWADHRAYMEKALIDALRRTKETVRELDPGALASLSGTQVPTAHNGANWYELDQFIDYLQPYSGGGQDIMHYLFKPGIKLTGFTGYGLTGARAQEQQWRRLFYGHTGASIFWHYTLLNPDLTMSEQGKALAEAFGRIQSGIGRVFMESTVREDGVAIHFSMASIRGAWIQDGVIKPTIGNVLGTSKNFAELSKRRDAWINELERQGLQFRFLASPQIESGALDKFKVLVMPYSIALSDKETAEIKRFLDRGGVIYADEQLGRMDERCHWRKQPAIPETTKGVIVRGPGEVGLKRPVDVEGDFLVTVRDFGKSRLIGLLPKSATKISVPATSGVYYDLLRGGPVKGEMEVGPDKPAVMIERQSRVAKLDVDPRLNIRLWDEAHAAVDRSVVRVEVYGPDKKLVRHYSGNVTVVDGKASFRIPFAVNDPAGRWMVRARDVISGTTASRVIVR